MEMYLAEGLMLKAHVAPFPLMVSCSKSRTTVDAGRCTQCHPSNVHQEVNKADSRKKKHHQEGDEDVPRKKKTASSRENASQKLDRPHTPEQVSRCKTPVPEACSPKNSVRAKNGMRSTWMPLNKRTLLVRERWKGR
jgi:hypothetical protein